MISNISSLCLSCCNCKFELAARDNVRRVLSNNSIGTTIVSNMSERFLTSILFLHCKRKTPINSRKTQNFREFIIRCDTTFGSLSGEIPISHALPPIYVQRSLEVCFLFGSFSECTYDGNSYKCCFGSFSGFALHTTIARKKEIPGRYGPSHSRSVITFRECFGQVHSAFGNISDPKVPIPLYNFACTTFREYLGRCFGRVSD